MHDGRGEVSVVFETLDQPLEIIGKEMEVTLKGDPKYIAHID